MSVSLDHEEKGILKYLGKGYEESISLDNIEDYLKVNDYQKLSKQDLIKKLDHLIDAGYVRSKTEGVGKNRLEKFYLSKVLAGLEGGIGKKRSLQGRGPWHDASRLIRRLLGSFFLLIGFGLFLYEVPNLTGAVIGVHTSGFLVGVLFIFIALLLFFIKPKKK